MKKILLAGLALSGAVHADINNEPFTYIGFAGGTLTYKESGTVTGNVNFETNPSNFQVFNYSGGYTAIGERTGFYINTVSTLYASTDDESWTFSSENGSGEHQQNKMTSNHNAIDLLFGYLMGSGHQVIAGVGYRRNLMDRNSFQEGSDVDTFNDVRYAGETTSLTESEYDSKYGLSFVDGQIVNYTETFTSFMAQVGYRYDTRFKSADTGARWQFGATLGVPVYYEAVNTSKPQYNFSSMFDGYNIDAYVGYGWRFTENLGVLAKANYSYRIRGEMKENIGYNSELNRNRYAIIPENIVSFWNVGLNGYWNF